MGIVFEPIKDTVVKTTLYQRNKNHFNNKPLIVGGYSIEPIKDTEVKTIHTKQI